MLSAEDLLAGSALTFEVAVPPEVLYPSEVPATGNGANGSADAASGNGAARAVKLRPLTVGDLQIIARAAKESDALIATLMVQRALVEPQMTVAAVAGMHVGLQQFLLQHVNRISGITTTAEELSTATEAPLAKAAFVLAREFGWTPEQVNDLTLGQVLLHLQMLRERTRHAG